MTAEIMKKMAKTSWAYRQVIKDPRYIAATEEFTALKEKLSNEANEATQQALKNIARRHNLDQFQVEVVNKAAHKLVDAVGDLVLEAAGEGDAARSTISKWSKATLVELYLATLKIAMYSLEYAGDGKISHFTRYLEANDVGQKLAQELVEEYKAKAPDDLDASKEMSSVINDLLGLRLNGIEAMVEVLGVAGNEEEAMSLIRDHLGKKKTKRGETEENEPPIGAGASPVEKGGDDA
jgi:hypothetical protein